MWKQLDHVEIFTCLVILTIDEHFSIKMGERKEMKTMDRKEIYKEIEEIFGLVPTFIKMVPDSSLELE